ncbi:MAG: pehB [Proteobacteria bacterium]|nr:pehB [Pseudomonadota bacterium]
MSHTLFGYRTGALILFTCLLAACGGSSSNSSSSSESSSNSEGSTLSAPTDLAVPTLAYDDTSLNLVWKKPASYARVTDYNVYLNGTKIGSAAANNTTNSPAKPYIDAFYTADTAAFHTKVTFHNYTVTGLSPDTRYSFTVRAVDASGNESADSTALTVKTAPAFTNVVNIANSGAVGDGSTVNTTVIQNAIDTCAASSTSAYGCKVLVPADAASGKIFVTGALFLKSNMTLEIAEGATLKASSASTDFPISSGYQLYSYQTNSTDDRRPPSLLNALSSNHRNGLITERSGYDETRNVFTNIRIVGKGILDGNGWNRLADITDETSQALPQFAAGSSSTYSSLGVLAKSQMAAAVAELPSGAVSDLYSNRRSSLTTFRGVNGIYVGGLTLRNPAYHGVMFIESQNIVFAGTTSQSYDVNNGDGVEFGNSENITVFSNFFDTGDDDVNFAAGQGSAYENGNPAQNAWIFNNYMREGHGAVVAGSHTGAWIQDILAEDNVMYHTDNGLRMKSIPATGGGARRVTFRDNAMKDITTNAFIFTLSYSAGSNVFTNAANCAQFQNITVTNVTLDNLGSSSTKAFLSVDGYAGTDATLGYAETFQEAITFDTVKITGAKPSSISRLKNSTFKDVTITNVTGGTTPWVISNSSNNTFINVSPAP